MTESDDPRRRLLETAGRIFAEKGFDGATVRDICRQGGVNIAAVNYYFGDKERLYIEAVKSAACGSLEAQSLPAWPADTPPVVKLRDFIRVMVGRLMNPDKPAWHARLMMRELTEPTAACAEWVEEYVRPHAAVLKDILAELLPPGTPDFQRFLTGFSIMGQCLFYMHCKPVVQLLMGSEYARITPQVVAGQVTDFSLAALGLKPLRRKAERVGRQE
ncbi:MAG TPA: CerR family C-terminal domain-containing protein [Gemmataceae bacterium]|nr:CerR family C-terminal domain-containing protein [Gemmataceae bacterium]